MKRWFAAFIFISMIGSATVAAAKGPEVELIDSKLSINAEAISVSRLLQLIDLATGMKSKVPPELANRNVSVKFSGLSVTDGVRKMFQGLPLDYVMIAGQGIIVTAASQTITGGGDAVPTYNQPGSQRDPDQPFTQDFSPPPTFPQQQQGQQPPMVQTPFGPIPNPRAQQQQQPFAPINNPGQQNSLFPQSPQQIGQPQQVPVMPGVQMGNPPPFGQANPFGTPNPQFNNQNNNLFGTPPVFSSPGAPPR